MKMEQNIVTGGTKSTSTPMLKFLIKNALFEPANAERHMAHCPNAVVLSASRKAPVPTTNNQGFSFANTRINVPAPQPQAAAVLP